MDFHLVLLFATTLFISNLHKSSGNSHLINYDQAVSSSSFGEPVFRLEPPNIVNFANTRGAIIPCLVSGSPRPKITWYTTSAGDMGQQTILSGNDLSTNQQQQQSRLVNNVTNLRKVTQNGAALILLPFKETDFRQEIHSTEYRCVASNNIATIHSRSALAQAVISNAGTSSGGSNENVKVNDEFVVLNTPAVLKCKATSELEFSQLVGWFTSDGIRISAGETSKGNKFTAFKSGELHIANVDISDLQRTYGCKMRNTITNKVSLSSGLAQLIVTESSSTNQLEASPSHSNLAKLLKQYPPSTSIELNHQFANLHLAKQTTSQVLHSVSQFVTSDQLSPEELHNSAIDSDKSFYTHEWRLLLPCAVRTLASNSIAVGAGDESSKLFEMRWFFQASSLHPRRDDTQKPVIPLEQYAAASSISLQYLNFVSQSPALNSSLPVMAPMKSGSRSQIGGSSSNGNTNNNNNNHNNNIGNHNKQDKSTKFVVGPTFLAIEWPTQAQSGRYVCQLVSRTQEQSTQEPLSRTVCDINVIIRQPMKLKVEAVTKLSASGETPATSSPTKAALSSDPLTESGESMSETSKSASGGNLLTRAMNWFSEHTPLYLGGQKDSLLAIQPMAGRGTSISSRSRRANNSAQFLKRQTLLEQESSRVQVQGPGLIEPPPIVRVGERLQLDCLGSGHPIEIVKWFKNGQAINTQSSSDFQVEITSIGDNDIPNAQDTPLNRDMLTSNQQTTEPSTTISSLVIRQLQPRDAGLAMFECFTYNSFGDKARAGLAIMVIERQLVDWARSVCLVNSREESNSSWSGSGSKQWESAENPGRSQEMDLSIGLPEYHNSIVLEEQEFGNDWTSNSLIFKRNNPLKQVLLLESEPVELSCSLQRFLRSNLPLQQPGTQNLSVRLDWRRWRPQQSSLDSRQDSMEQMRESRNFNQLFSGDSRFVINGSSLQIRSPSKRHDEAIYLCRLMISRRDQKLENYHGSNSASISTATAFQLEASALHQRQFAAKAVNAETRSPSASDSLLDLNLVHQSSLAVSPTSVSASCINSMQDIFVQPTVAAAAATTSSKQQQQQDFSDQVTLAMSSISIRIVAKPKIDPFEFSRSLEEGMRAVVVCAVISGHSPVDITWFKDGQLLVADNYQDQDQDQASLSIDQANSFSSTLTFHSIKASHSGLYTCVATNAFAATNHTSRLTVNVAPYFIDAPKNTQAVLNSNVLVNCRAGGQPTPQIRWRKLVPAGGILGSKSPQAPSGNGKFDFFDVETSPQMAPQIIQQQQHQLLQQQQIGSNKFEFRVITSNSHIQILENGSMIIKDVQSSDSSRYVCQAFNGINPSLSEVIDLLVLSPAQFDVNYETISVKRDALIKFNCAPKGDQPMQIEWRKEGNLLVAAPGSVSAGSFQNQASNSNNNKPAQQQQSKYSEIAFLYDSNVSSITSNDQLRQRHSNLVLQPPSQMREQLQRELASFIQDDNLKPAQEGLRSSELFINYADRTDTGTFVCIARNAYGKDELTYRLAVQEVPDVPLNLNVQMVQANSLKLTWLAPFDGNLPLSHFIIEYRKIMAHNPQSLSGSSHKEQQQQQPQPLLTTSTLPTPMPLQMIGLSDTSLRHTSEWIRLVLSVSKLNSEILAPINTVSPAAVMPLNGSYLQQQQQYSVMLRQLTAKSTYHIRVAAVNAIGQGSFTPHLSVTTAEEPPSIRPNDVRTQPLSSSSIKVLWRGPALMDEQAPIKGYYVSHRKLVQQQANSIMMESTSTLATSAEVVQATGEQAQKGSAGNWIATHSISVTNSTFQALDGDGGVISSRQYGTSVGGSLNSITTSNLAAAAASTSANNNQLSLIGQLGLNYEFIINHLDKSTKYEIRVQPYNAMGVGPGSEVIGQTLKFDRPGQANLKLVGSRKQSFELKWTISDEQPLMGFSLFYKAEYDDWQEIQLGIIYHYVIDNLRCGNKYQIYLSAFNAVGRSDPSDVLNVRTEGTVPIAPDKNQFLKSNITEMVLDMSSWQSGGCSISSFMIQFKRLHESNWFILSEGATPFANTDKITIPDLTPATWYKLLVTALNEAGSTNAEYLFSTLNLNGEEIAPAYQFDDHETVGHHQSSWLGGSSHGGRSLWSSLNQYLFPTTISTSSLPSSQHNNESGQLLLPVSCILLLLVASIASYLYYSKTNGNSNSPNSTSSNVSNFSGHSQTLKSCYQNGLRNGQMQQAACESTNTTLARNIGVSNVDEKQLIQSNHNLHHHLIDAKSFALDASDQVALSHEQQQQQQQQQQQTQTLGRPMLDSLIGSASGLHSFVGTSSRPQRSQHGMKLLSSANIFSNSATNNNTNNTPNSNCTSSSISTHSTNCFEGSTGSSSGTSNVGAGSKAKLQLIDESSMISDALEGRGANHQDDNNNISQYYYDTSAKQHNSSPARFIYSALRANNHVDVVNQSCNQGQSLMATTDSPTFGNLFGQNNQADTHSRVCNSFANQRQLLSTSFASAADLLQRQQLQQQHQVYYQNQHQQEEPIYQRLDKFQSYGLAAVFKQPQQQQQFVDHASRAQTLRFNTHFSPDDTAKSMTLHRQTFQQPQQMIDQNQPQQQQQQFASHGFYDQSLGVQGGGGLFQPSEQQQITYDQQQPSNNNGNNISEIEQHIMCNNINNNQK